MFSKTGDKKKKKSIPGGKRMTALDALKSFSSSQRMREKEKFEDSVRPRLTNRQGTYVEGGSFFEEVVAEEENANNYGLLNKMDKNKEGEISMKSFFGKIKASGIELTDDRVKEDIKNLKKLNADYLPAATLLDVLNHNTFLEAVFGDKLVVELFAVNVAMLKKCVKAARQATNPKTWSFAACTTSGQQVELGDSLTFTLMETCMPILYAAAVRQHGVEKVHEHVGREPSGVGLDNRELASNDLPHNPYTKAGGIMCSSLIDAEKTRAGRSEVMEKLWTDLMGTSKGPSLNNSHYLKMRETRYMEYCVAYMMREVNAFPEGTDINKTLDFYFMNMSMETTCKALARVAGTLANGGLCPFTERRVLSPAVVRDVLSLMQSCGMNDRSGNFQFNFGYPSKTGTSGSMMVVVPGLIGFAVYSPEVDAQGNTLFGYTLCKELSTRFRFHMLEKHEETNLGRVREQDDEEELDHMSMFFAAAEGDLLLLRRLVAKGTNINAPDYDLRTPMHIAAIEGHYDIVVYLTMIGASVNPRDRFGKTPLDDAKSYGQKEIAKFLANPPEIATVYEEASREGVDTKAMNRLSYIGSMAAMRRANQAVMDVSRFSTPGSTASQLGAEDTALYYQYLKSLVQVTKENAIPPKVSELLDLLEQSGLEPSRFANFNTKPKSPLTIDLLDRILSESPVVEKALTGNLIIPEWKVFCNSIVTLYEECEKVTGGQVATYIPQLASVDPKKFGIAVCSVDGQRFAFGDHDESFSVQSCSKTISYCIAQETTSQDYVHKHVDREPSGKIFNNLELDRNNRPHNPLINAGAIMTVSLIRPDLNPSERFDYVCSVWKDCGTRMPTFSHGTYLSELETADRNFSLGYLMREKGAFPAHVNSHSKLSEVMEQYFQICSLEMTCQELSVVAATLAHGGVNPFTHKRVFKEKHVRNCLSVMYSSGMYDYSGEFQFSIGIPCKSGVAGALMIVVPGVCGICTWSPRLDKQGNSVRGVEFCKKFAAKYLVHLFDGQIPGMSMYRPTRTSSPKAGLKDRARLREQQSVAKLAFAASKGDMYELQRLVSLGAPIEGSDYHGRTALHLAASEGQVKAVQWLCKAGAPVDAKDKWGMTPLDSAMLFKQSEAAKALEAFLI